MRQRYQFWQFLLFSVCFTLSNVSQAAPAVVSPTHPAPSVFASGTADRVTTASNNPATNASMPTAPKSTNTSVLPVLNSVPPVLNVHGYYLQDVNSGQVLASMNPDQRMAPASLTKLMTLYLTFEALQAGRIHLNDLVPISETAWKTGGSRMFVKVGDRVPVSELINGVIVDSGNDACVALAEFVGGTQDNFVNLMNQQAQLLNMKNTHYVDCTGLPDPNHYTTPHDIALLTRAMILNFPKAYPFFAEKTLTYNNITQPNRNRLLWIDPSVDGLKTGHTEEAGYCLVASARRQGTRLLSVLLGAPTDVDRAQFSEQLLDYGFHFFEGHKVYAADMPIEQVPVYFGKTNAVPIGVADNFYITVPTGQYSHVNMDLHLVSPLTAPLQKNEKIGEVTAVLDGKVLDEMPVIALAPVSKANVTGRIWDHLRLWIGKK